jgi:hypothetical protein
MNKWIKTNDKKLLIYNPKTRVKMNNKVHKNRIWCPVHQASKPNRAYKRSNSDEDIWHYKQ